MTCNCMGPQNGQPLCPCRMGAARQYFFRQTWSMPADVYRQGPSWYLAANILPVEGEPVLVYDNGVHHIAVYVAGDVGSKGRWSCVLGDLALGPDAYWTDLPRP